MGLGGELFQKDALIQSAALVKEKQQGGQVSASCGKVCGGRTIAILQRARQSFRQTIQALEAGLAKLQEGFASAEPLLLEKGLAEMRAGNELFNAFQAEFEAARSLSG